jgi:tripartite-type tricarboxylate transporter receptor subunit TctC
MKKILLMLTLSFLSISTDVMATQVKVYWPFAAASPQALMVRELLISANEQQSKYSFIFVHQPGAGGSIAANSTINDRDISLLASTSSFYIRPMLYENSHDINEFSMISTVCLGQPLGIFSKDISLLEKQNLDKTVGVIPGSITSLVAMTIKKQNPGIDVRMISFKSTPESTTALLGNHIDASVDFVGRLTTDRLGESVKVIGITGKTEKDNYQTFSSLGINGLEHVVNDYFIFASTNLDLEVQKELNSIFNKAINTKVNDICNDAYGVVQENSYLDVERLHLEKQIIWEEIILRVIKE